MSSYSFIKNTSYNGFVVPDKNCTYHKLHYISDVVSGNVTVNDILTTGQTPKFIFNNTPVLIDVDLSGIVCLRDGVTTPQTIYIKLFNMIIGHTIFTTLADTNKRFVNFRSLIYFKNYTDSNYTYTDLGNGNYYISTANGQSSLFNGTISLYVIPLNEFNL